MLYAQKKYLNKMHTHAHACTHRQTNTHRLNIQIFLDYTVVLDCYNAVQVNEETKAQLVTLVDQESQEILVLLD